MEKFKLNVNKTPQVQSKEKGSDTPSTNVQDVLAARLDMTPEMLVLLKQEGKVSEGEFQNLLEVLSEQGEQPETLFGSKTSKADLLKFLKSEPKLDSEMMLDNSEENQEKVLPTKKESKLEVKTGNKKALTIADLMTTQKKNTASKVGAYQVETNKSIINNTKNIKTGETQIIGENSTNLSLQEVMFGGNAEQSSFDSNNENSQNSSQAFKMAPKMNIDTSSKVFDMSQLSQTSGSEEVISKIQDYILQTKVGNEKQVEFSFQHKELGQVGLSVHKQAGDALNIVITTNSSEGAKFFNQTQGELIHSLTQAGVQVGDLKLDSAKAGTGQDQSGDTSKQFAGNNKGNRDSENGERQQEQDRRKSLWDQFSEDQVAA